MGTAERRGASRLNHGRPFVLKEKAQGAAG
jgi:hypothetical protein